MYHGVTRDIVVFVHGVHHVCNFVPTNRGWAQARGAGLRFIIQGAEFRALRF